MKLRKIKLLSAALSVLMLMSVLQIGVSAYIAPNGSDVEETLSTGFSQTDTYEIYPVVQRMETNILPEQEISVLLGDVNSDTEINASDAVTVLQAFAGILDESDERYNSLAADVNNSGTVDSSDAVLILQHFAGIIDEFPAKTVISGGENVFRLSEEINVVFESGVDVYTQNFLKELLENYSLNYSVSDDIVKDKTNILIGINNSGELADEYIKNFSYAEIQTEDLFEKTDAYVLSALQDTIAIVGCDTDAAFYGISTLQMMFSSFAAEHFITAFIEDYADVEYRGFIEGMYARWGDEGRESLMRFARDVKMNTYVYASKQDRYHTSACTELYPENEIKAIERLVEVGKETKCYYGWSFHLSGFLSGLNASDEAAYEAKFQKLLAKLQQLYDVGVRKFDVLNDDFGGGSYEVVVNTLNRINREFIIPKGCDTMAYCPQGYNKAWAGNGSELTALQGLDDDIMIFWTGDDVNAPMTQSTIDYAAQMTGHDVCTWLNYPVNEHAKSGLFLGDITHYARDGVTGQRGALSNPCLYPEASKVALYQLACLWWNNSDYSDYAIQLWEDSFKYLEPEVYDAYSTIAHNISNCPGSTRVSYFNESEYIKEMLESVLAKIKSGQDITEDEETAALTAEFAHIVEAIETMRSKCDNETLLAEIDSWLSSLEAVASACLSSVNAAIAVQQDDMSAAWDALSDASLKISTWDSYSYTNGDGSASYAKSGSRRLVPFANSVIAEATAAVMLYLDPDNDSVIPSFIGTVHGNEITPNNETNKMLDGNDSTYASFNSIQLLNDYVGVDLGRVINVKSVRILQGSSDSDHDFIHDGVLEYSADGKTWTEIETFTSNRLHEVQNLDIEARFVRLRVTGFRYPSNPSKTDYWLHVREFQVNYDQTSDESYVITNVDSLKEVEVVEANNTVTASLPSSITLNGGEYFGLDLKTAYFSESIQTDIAADGLDVQYSANGAVWTAQSAAHANDTVRYIRLINSGTASVTASDVRFSVSTQGSELTPSMYENNLTNSLRGGSWANVFDGDLTTYVWTNEGQVTGQFITFDLGSEIALYDVAMYFSDNPVKPRLYYAEIQISTDNENWETVYTFNNDLVNDYELSGDYRIAKFNANGQNARYMRSYITADGPDNPFTRIQEIEINKTIRNNNPEIGGTLAGALENIIDGDLSTLYLGDTETAEGDYIRYVLTDNIALKSFMVIQNSKNVSNADVSVVDTDGNEHILGKLDASVNAFDVSQYNGILEIKLVFPEGVIPEIYEITKQVK